MNLIKAIKDFFRRDSYYEISDGFSPKIILEFHLPSDSVFDELKKEILKLPLNNKVSFPKHNLLKSNSHKFNSIESVTSKVSEILEKDYRDIKNSSQENGYSFQYSVASMELFPDSLVIMNTLEYPESYNRGKVVYNLVTLLRAENNFLLWDLTES